ncbi:MAG: hypothetical protein K2K56_15310 [Lachnospiraceae bacterium]|nr:hypothetical protein [Lachnospiraceae bacterium]
MSKLIQIASNTDISLDTAPDDHVFSKRFEERQRNMIEQVKNAEAAQQKKKWKVAAAFILLVGISTTAGATSLFKLENMIISKEDKTTPNDNTKDKTTSGDNTDTPTGTPASVSPKANLIALAIPESAEWKASQEWQTFRRKYERSYEYEEALLMADAETHQGITNHAFSQYSEIYGIYTQEMADKLEEICTKYNLIPESRMISISSYEELISKMQLDSFIKDTYTADIRDCIACSEGNWHATFDLKNAQEGILSELASIVVSKKGVLNSLDLNIGDISDYTEWSYTTENNEVVDIVINNQTCKSYIFYKGAEDFVVVNLDPIYTYYQHEEILEQNKDQWTTYTETELTKEQVQKIADVILFSNIIQSE